MENLTLVPPQEEKTLLEMLLAEARDLFEASPVLPVPEGGDFSTTPLIAVTIEEAARHTLLTRFDGNRTGVPQLQAEMWELNPNLDGTILRAWGRITFLPFISSEPQYQATSLVLAQTLTWVIMQLALDLAHREESDRRYALRGQPERLLLSADEPSTARRRRSRRHLQG